MAISIDLEYKLILFESPFTWTLPNLRQEDVDDFLNSMLEKHESDNDIRKFKWRSFSVRLILAYELWDKLGDVMSAKHVLTLCEKELNILSQMECSERLFNSIHCALWHVVLATGARLAFDSRHGLQAHQMIDRITPLSEMTIYEHAGMYGIKATLLSLYGKLGCKQALVLAKMASDMDPDQAEWHYLVANCMGKIRGENGFVTKEEIDEIQQACLLDPVEPIYVIALAETFTDVANVCAKIGTQEEQKNSNEYTKKAVIMFKKALKLVPNCVGLKARIAHGLVAINNIYVADVPLTKYLLHEVLNCVPSKSKTDVYFNLGVYYDKFEENPEEAMKYFSKAHSLGHYPAFLKLITLKWTFEMDSELASDVKFAMNRYISRQQSAELWMYLGVLHLLKDEWNIGIECLVKCLGIDPSATCIENFCGFYSKNKINLLEAVTNELRIKTKENCKCVNIFHTFLGKIISINQKLFKIPPVPELFIKFKVLQINNRKNLQLLYRTK